MPGTLHHAKILGPRTHGLAILMGHDPGDLVQMSQVMSSPCGQQLRKSNDSERGMQSTAFKVLLPETKGTQLGEAL